LRAKELRSNSQGKEDPTSVFSASRFSRALGGRWFSAKNPGYSVISGSSDENVLFNEQNDTEQLERRKLVLYSKPGCCLCDALKEKLQLVFMLGGDHDLSDVELEVTFWQPCPFSSAKWNVWYIVSLDNTVCPYRLF